MVRNVNFDRRNIQGTFSSMNFPLIKIQGNGGGKWYNLWNGSLANQGSGYRHLLVDGTTQPLSFYMFNFEHANGDIMAEFDDVSNVEIYQYKAEGDKPDAKFTNSNQFRVFGFGGTSTPPTGSANIEVEASTNFLLANADFQQIIPGQSGAVDPSGNYRVEETLPGGGTVQTGGWEQFVLYKQGSPHTTDPAVSLFSDDFQDGDSSGWTVNGGTWSVATSGSNKSYHQDAVSITAKSPAGDTAWTDYSVEAQIMVSSWNSAGSAGVIGRYLDGNNQYMLRYNNGTGKLNLEKRIGGTVTVLDSVAVTAPSVGVYHTFKLDMNGSSLTGYLDGVQKVSATDSARSSGKIGLYTFDQKADFDNVVVK
jgi:hypothetical protein